jgi:hypothetical protein
MGTAQSTVARAAAGLVAIVLAVLPVAGCARGDSRSGSDQPGVQGPTSLAPGAPGPRVSADDPSVKDVAAWLRANGVSDPEKWAGILRDNQPYPDGPEGTKKIRDVLTQHGASEQDIAAITNTVTP